MNVYLTARVCRISFQIVLFLVFTPVILFAEGYSVAQRPSRRAEPKDEVAVSQLRQAAELLQQGRPSEAERILHQVISAMPQNADAHNLLGVILDQREQFKEAEQEFRAALRLNRDAISPLANLGVLLGRTGRSDEAIRAFESVLQRAPAHPQATLNLGIQYVARKDYARALSLLERADSLVPDNYEVKYNLGLTLYNLKRYDEASNSLQTSSSLAPGSADPLYYLGLICWSRQQDEAAAEFWDRAVNLRANFPEANFMLGEALRKNRRTEASVEFYKRALDQDPTKFVYYARLGGVYIVLGQPGPAGEVFRRGVLRFPKLAEAHYFAGISARAMADYDTADAELRKSLALETNNVNALAQLGFVLLERDRMTEAETVLRRAIAINDKHFYASYDLGRLLVKSRKYDEALPVLQHAIILKPTNPGVHYQLFIALSRLKRKDDADRELATFKELDEARKARPRSEADIEDEDLQNPGPSSASDRPTPPRD